jgi:hypothetical protein
VLSGDSAHALAEYANLSEVARSGKDPLVSAIAAYACAASGSRNEAQTILTRLKNLAKQRYVDPYEIAMVYAGLGENDAAFEWLERTYREHSMSVALFSSEPFLMKLHSDSRFQDLIRRAHLPTPP